MKSEKYVSVIRRDSFSHFSPSHFFYFLCFFSSFPFCIPSIALMNQSTTKSIAPIGLRTTASISLERLSIRSVIRRRDTDMKMRLSIPSTISSAVSVNDQHHDCYDRKEGQNVTVGECCHCAWEYNGDHPTPPCHTSAKHCSYFSPSLQEFRYFSFVHTKKLSHPTTDCSAISFLTDTADTSQHVQISLSRSYKLISIRSHFSRSSNGSSPAIRGRR